MSLSPEHLATFTESGIPSDVANQIAYTETDPAAIAKLLNWSRPAESLGECIIIPFPNRDGTPSGFCRVRPSKPRIVDGKPAKYEQPRGAALRAYFTPQALAAINTPLQSVAFTEGEKKSLAVSIAGIPCIGLTGVFSWQKPKSKGGENDRELIEDLALIDWQGRQVLIIFDTDPRRNPNVNLAAAELARILETHGAKVTGINLPLGPIGSDGMPGKMGADDFIVAHGAEAFRQLVTSQCTTAAPRKVEDYQRDVARERIESLKTPGVAYLDRSPPGAGKSTAAIAAKGEASKSITILATHKNCEEEQHVLEEHYLDAAAYPQLSGETCRRYPEAERVLNSGLSISGALCQSCHHKDSCEYQQGMKTAKSVAHSISTHHRAALSMNDLAKGKRFIDVHEDPVGLLRPSISISTNFEMVASVAHYAKRDCLKSDFKMREAPFFQLMEEYSNWINDILASATESGSLEIPDFEKAPATADATLLWAMQSLDTWPAGDAVRIAKGLAAGDFCSLVLQVDPIFEQGGKPGVRKKITAYRQTKFPTNAVVWLNDATANADELAALCNLPVVDRTPGGRIEQRFPIVQVPADLKKSTAASVFVRTLSVVIRRTGCQRIGIICDRQHVPAVKGTAKKGPVLAEDLRARIARVEYFRGGEGRGSNSWLGACDLMIIAGTPRVPPEAIRSRLLRAGKHAAAARPDDATGWGPDWWSGRTVRGKLRTVKTLAYRDRDWHQSHCDSVRAELLQCIGRGRTIRENGMPVVVITAENLASSENPLGFQLSNSEIYFLSESEEKILAAMRKLLSGKLSTGEPATVQDSQLSGKLSTGESAQQNGLLSGQLSTIYILESLPLSSSAIGKEARIDSRFAIRILNTLHKKHLVEKIGQRGGWKFTADGLKVAPA